MANIKDFALFSARRPSIGNLVANCTLTERHGARYYIASSPIENGAYVTDHVIRQPIMLDMVAIFSPYQDNFIGNSNLGATTKTTWSRIRALADSRIPFDVYTILQLYKNMLFESFDHTEQDENIIRLQATLRNVEFATVQTDIYLADSVANNLSSASDVGLQSTSAL